MLLYQIGFSEDFPGKLYNALETCLCYRTTLHFDFLHSFMVCAQTSGFLWYTRRLVTIEQKCNFFLSWVYFACCLVWYLYECAVENSEISGFCVSKSRGLCTDHK